MTYVLLTGARINVGDFLIAARAKALLAHVRPDIDLVELPRWEPLDGALDLVNSSRALLLCGGPAVRPDMYPGIYPLVSDLTRIRVPIVPVGVGWKGSPGDEKTLGRYRLQGLTTSLLQRVEGDGGRVGARDFLTMRALKLNGVNQVVMTGCPAWYDVRAIGTPLQVPGRVRRVLFSLPVGRQYFRQAMEVLEGLQRLVPHAEVACTFNHGWEQDPYLTPARAEQFAQWRSILEARGIECISLARDLDGMFATMEDADLHVGYRLHSHLLFLSRRKPSFLLEEDGRGRGASEALGIRGVQAWVRNPISMRARDTVHGFLRPASGIRPRDALARIRPRAEASHEMLAYVDEEIQTGFGRSSQVSAVIDHFYARAMQPFLESLP